MKWISGLLFTVAAILLLWQFATDAEHPLPAVPRPAELAGSTALWATRLEHKEFRHRQTADREALERRLTIAHNPFLQLTTLPVDGPVSSLFGNRVLISFSLPRFHSGVDVKAAVGTPVLAAADGTVTFAGRKGTYGVLVALEHRYGLVTRYAHMDKAIVAVGDVVKAGDQIGTVGKTGKTTGANLHFEVLLDDQYQDPGLLLPWPGGLPERRQKPTLDASQIPRPGTR